MFNYLFFIRSLYYLKLSQISIPAIGDFLIAEFSLNSNTFVHLGPILNVQHAH